MENKGINVLIQVLIFISNSSNTNKTSFKKAITIPSLKRAVHPRLLPGLKDSVEAFGKTWRTGECADKVQFSDSCVNNPAMLQMAQDACAPIKNSQECVDDDDR